MSTLKNSKQLFVSKAEILDQLGIWWVCVVQKNSQQLLVTERLLMVGKHRSNLV